MPYSVGEKGSYGCPGYPVVKDGTSDVMGCHDTAAEAAAQIAAIESNETYEEKEVVASGGGVGIKNPQSWPGTRISEEERSRKKEKSDVWSGSFSSKLTNKSNYNDNTGGWLNPKPITETSGFQNEIETRNNINSEIGKEQMEIKEGDFVMGPTVDGMVFGRVEHIMWEGGTLGEAGTEYALESMPPENPAMSVRVFEVEENEMEATPYSIGMMYQDAQVVDVSSMTMEQENEMEMLAKAETYSPNSGMKAAARRAIKWREDGKSKGAGTPVGWGRARDIVAGRSMSLSVVKRMYSFFSRHEVDKKGEGFFSGPNFPSKGRVMWDAWGGDAGFSWSRAIAKRNEDKALFADFGKDFTKGERFVVKAESVRIGQMVSWNSSGGRAQGKVTRIIRNGSYDVPGTDVTINGTEDNPAVVIRLYRDGEATDVTVAHRMSTLRSI